MGPSACPVRPFAPNAPASIRLAARLLLFVSLGLGSLLSPPLPTVQALTTSAYASDCANDTSFGGKSWNTNVTGAQGAPDGGFAASQTIKDGQTTNYLRCRGYGFSIPANATIEGITVAVTRKNGHTTGITDLSVRLAKGTGSATLSVADKADAATIWTDLTTTVTYGGSADLWATSWTPSEINSSTFGVKLAAIAKDGATDNNQNAQVDSIQVTVAYRTPSQLGMTVNSGNPVTAGAPFSVVVQSQDSAGTPTAVGSDTAITITKTAGPGTLGGTTTGTLTAGSSSVTISGLTLTTVGTVTLQAARTSGETLTSVSVSGITVVAGPVSSTTSTVTASPASVKADGVATATVTVTLKDGNSNVVSGKTVTIDDGVATTSISPASATTNSSGVASFTVSSSTGGTVLYTATDTTDSIVLSQMAQVRFTASKLVITDINGGADVKAGVPFSVTVQAQDATNNATIISNSSPTTVTLTHNGTGALSGGSGSISANGTSVTISGVTYSKVEGSLTLTASATGLTAGTAGFTVVPGNPSTTNSTISNPCGSGCTAGSSFTVTVTAKDGTADQNPVPNAIATVSLVDSGGTGATLSGATSVVADSSGVSTFSLSINKKGSFQVRAFICPPGGANPCLSSSPNAAGPKDTSTFTITAGAPSSSTSGFTQSPSNSTAGTAFGTQPQVTVKDALGNTVGSAIVTLEVTGGGATLNGTTTATTNASGVASFSGLSINTAGGYTLIASICAPGGPTPCPSGSAAASAVSNAFTISAASAASSQSSFSLQPCPDGCTAGQTFITAVSVADQFGNPASGKKVTLSVTGATLGGTTTATSGSSGVASFSGLSITTAGNFTLTAKICDIQSPCTSAATATISSASFAITGASPSTITTPTVSCAPSCTAGAVFTVTATVTDQYGNLVSNGTSVNISVAASPSGAQPLNCTTCVATTTSGQVTFSGDNLFLRTAGSGYQLKLTSGAANATSSAFSVAAAAPSTLTFATPPSDATEGFAISPAVVVEIQDAFGNRTTSTATVSVSLNGGAFTSDSTTSVAAVAGRATFSNLKVDAPGAGLTITATSSGLTSATSVAFDVSAFVGSFQAPKSVALDKLDGLWVADANTNRVLHLPKVQITSPGANTDPLLADIVLGQPNLTVITAGASSTKMNGPTSVALDAKGNIYVADKGNNRVLRFDAKSETGAAANLVLGQANFTSTSSGSGDAQMNAPTGVAVDSKGNIYVADTGNNRVLKFASTAVSGDAATVVLNTGLSGPKGVAVDSKGNIYVADTGNHQVKVYPSTATSGSSPTVTLGSTSGTTSTQFKSPEGVATDAKGNLYVLDTGNHRILQFTAKNIAAGAIPNQLWGQNDFSSGSANAGGSATVHTVNGPTGAAVSKKGNLFVADTGNTRILVDPSYLTLVQPKTVALSGSGFGTSGTLKWGIAGTDPAGSEPISISSSTVCDSTTKVGCITSWTDTKISVVPPPRLNNVKLTIRVDNGAPGAASSQLDNTYYYGPVVTGLSPRSGVGAGGTAGGTLVTISGANFSKTSTVQVGNATLGKCATGQVVGCVKSASPTKVLFYTPSQTDAGSASPTVTVVGANVSTQADNTFYFDKTVVTSMVPLSGSSAGGTKVTITGSGFGTTPVVKFGATAGTIVSASDTKIVVTSPAGTGAVSVTVENGTSTGVASSQADNTFRYDRGVVTLVSPLSAAAAGGAQVTISGSGFGTTPQVRFGSATIDVSDPLKKCSATLTTGCWKSAADTKIIVQAPSKDAPDNAGLNPSVTVNNGTNPGVASSQTDNTFRYDTPVLTGIK